MKHFFTKKRVALGALLASSASAMAAPVDAFGQVGLEVSTTEVVAVGGILLVGSLVIWTIRKALGITGR